MRRKYLDGKPLWRLLALSFEKDPARKRAVRREKGENSERA